MEVKTKLNIGDTLWIMYNNRPREIKINHIGIKVSLQFDGFTNKTSVSIYYRGWVDCFKKEDFSYEEDTIGKQVFLTKEDLINSLL